MNPEHLTINLSGSLMNFAVPKVMGIVNVTNDSFYSKSRVKGKEEILKTVGKMISDGADIIDVGGCSTRPGAEDVGPRKELELLQPAFETIRENFPSIPLSVDTYHSEVARESVEKWGVNIINDISGGTIDPEIWNVAGELRVPYVLTHMRGTPEDMGNHTDYEDITAEVVTEFSKKLFILHEMGLNDIILDPGFGFAKTVKQNFQLLRELNEICEIGLPVLVGISRKSMIWKTLDSSPEDSLDGTIALNAIALEKGANIIRVHDVKEAKRTVRLINSLKEI